MRHELNCIYLYNNVEIEYKYKSTAVQYMVYDGLVFDGVVLLLTFMCTAFSVSTFSGYNLTVI